MADEEQRFFRAGAVNARDHIAFAVVGAEDLHIAGGKARVKQALGHRVGCYSGAAYGVGRINFDQLLENVAGKLFGGVVQLRFGLSRERSTGGGKSENQTHET